jgi:hypothetical protein
MSKPAKSTAALLAADVRAFYADPKHGEKRLSKISEKARVSVAPRAEGEKPLRGRISAEAVEFFNKTTRRGAYATGNTIEAVAAAKGSALTARVKAFEAGEAVGTRGPLSNAAKVAAGLPVPAKGKGKGSRKGK